MKKIGYGTPQAIQQNGKFYCMKCTAHMVERNTLPVFNPVLFTGMELLELFDIRTLLSRRYVHVERIYSEGQAGDQEILNAYKCHTCQDDLRKYCTDY